MPELVHKRAAAEAVVTAVDGDATGWTVHARLPRRHSFHADATGRQAGYHDPLFVLEAFRQGCLAASHLCYDVPLGFRHTVRYYEFAVLDWAALQADTAAELEIGMSVETAFTSAVGDTVNGLAVTATARRNGTSAMQLRTGFGWLPEDRWQLMRVGASSQAAPQPPRSDPRTVGRTRSANVVIGAPVHRRDDGSADAAIVVNPGCPTFFDHPLDHLPGGLILEASRQLAVAVLGAGADGLLGPSRLRCDFHSFAELDPACTVTLAPAPAAPVFRAEVSQSGRPRATLELAFEQ